MNANYILTVLCGAAIGYGLRWSIERHFIMKLSQVKSEVAALRADSAEALAELGTRIADLDKQIADLIAGASDPDITDEAFLADLQAARASSLSLKDIVPGSPTPPPA